MLEEVFKHNNQCYWLLEAFENRWTNILQACSRTGGAALVPEGDYLTSGAQLATAVSTPRQLFAEKKQSCLVAAAGECCFQHEENHCFNIGCSVGRSLQHSREVSCKPRTQGMWQKPTVLLGSVVSLIALKFTWMCCTLMISTSLWTSRKDWSLQSYILCFIFFMFLKPHRCFLHH